MKDMRGSGFTRERMQRVVKVAFTDFWHGNSAVEILANPLYKMLSRTYKLELSDKPDFLIYSCFGHRFLKYDCTRIFFTGENIRPDFDQCDYAFSFDYPVTERNYRLPLYHLYPNLEKLRHRHQHIPDSSAKKFCNFVYSNKKAPERISFLKMLGRYKEVDCGGKIMNNIGGQVDDKLEFLRNYKFTIAFENASYPGYTTEKITEALVAGTVPIYWGNPLIGRDFNPDCFINCHDFDNFDEVIDHVMKIDTDNDLYLKYISAPVFKNGNDNAFINEENLDSQIDRIFSGPTRSLAAGRADRLKYWFHPLRPWDFVKSRKRRWKQHRRLIQS